MNQDNETIIDIYVDNGKQILCYSFKILLDLSENFIKHRELLQLDEVRVNEIKASQNNINDIANTLYYLGLIG